MARRSDWQVTYFGHSHESPGKETHLDSKLKNLIG